MEEPLEYLNRAELQMNIMKNLEREIMGFHKNNKLRFWWERTPNWKKVSVFINGGTKKAGSTSSGEQCQFIGINPNKYLIKEN